MRSVVSVHDNGKFIYIQNFLTDQWDLSPQADRSNLYDVISLTGGVGYHYMLGGNFNLKTTASWTNKIWLK